VVYAKTGNFIKSQCENAQGLRVIIVVVQVGALKTYVVAVEALRKKERGDETQFTTKNW
jgi:hypothetical protein